MYDNISSRPKSMHESKTILTRFVRSFAERRRCRYEIERVPSLASGHGFEINLMDFLFTRMTSTCYYGYKKLKPISHFDRHACPCAFVPCQTVIFFLLESNVVSFRPALGLKQLCSTSARPDSWPAGRPPRAFGKKNAMHEFHLYIKFSRFTQECKKLYSCVFKFKWS